ETSRQARRAAEVFGATLFEARAGGGDLSPDPMFVVGLPRSGSTLVDQILSSHPDVEGTMELPEIAAIARVMGEASGADGYPEGAAALDGAALATLGRRF